MHLPFKGLDVQGHTINRTKEVIKELKHEISLDKQVKKMCGWLDGLDNSVVFTSVFTEEKWLLSFAHLDTTPSSISLCLTVPANSLTPCLLTFLMKLSTGGGLIPQLKQLQRTVLARAGHYRAPWSLFGKNCTPVLKVLENSIDR